MYSIKLAGGGLTYEGIVPAEKLGEVINFLTCLDLGTLPADVETPVAPSVATLPDKKGKEAAAGKKSVRKGGITQEQRDDVVRLCKAGKTSPEIQEEVGISGPSVYRILAENGLKTVRSNAKSEEAPAAAAPASGQPMKAVNRGEYNGIKSSMERGVTDTQLRFTAKLPVEHLKIIRNTSSFEHYLTKIDE